MALTRPMLKGMNLTEEQVQAIIDAHMETVDALKGERDSYKADAKKLADVQKELDGYKKGKDWKAEFDKEHQAFEDYKAEVASKEALAAKQAAFRKILADEGIPDKFHDRILRMTELDDVEMDGNTFKDEEAQRKAIRDEWGEFKATTQIQGDKPETPPSGKSVLSKAEIYARDEHGRYKLSTSERQKALAENPNLMQ